MQLLLFAALLVMLALLPVPVAMVAVIPVRVPGLHPAENSRAIFSRPVKHPEPHHRTKKDADTLVRLRNVRRSKVCTEAERRRRMKQQTLGARER